MGIWMWIQVTDMRATEQIVTMRQNFSEISRKHNIFRIIICNKNFVQMCNISKIEYHSEYRVPSTDSWVAP